MDSLVEILIEHYPVHLLYRAYGVYYYGGTGVYLYHYSLWTNVTLFGAFEMNMQFPLTL